MHNRLEIATDTGLVRPGRSTRGSRTVDAILQGAVQVLVEEGSAAFTLRRIAETCGLRIGNVTRHFPRKEMLIQWLLDDILTTGEQQLKSQVYDAGMSAEDALRLVISGTIGGSGSKYTTHLLTELWAMSNHNPFVADRIEALYHFVHTLIGSFVTQLNPSLDAEEVEAVSVTINALMEGATVLAGHGKPWESKMPLMRTIAANTLVEMAKTITSEEIRGPREAA